MHRCKWIFHAEKKKEAKGGGEYGDSWRGWELGMVLFHRDEGWVHLRLQDYKIENNELGEWVSENS